MSQARERYSGPRDSGQRQPRHAKKSPANRQGQPYAKGPPARDPAQTASIFKTRSFQLLVAAVGAENIALGLDSNLTRVAELMKGERFTPETAFHMETTLGLPHGFFDQPNPVLAPETIARLKSPLDFVQPDDEPEVLSETVKPASDPKVSQQPLFKDRLPEEPEMPKKATGGSPIVAQKSRNAAVQPGARTAAKSAPVKAKASPKASQQQPLALNDSAAVPKYPSRQSPRSHDSQRIESAARRGHGAYRFQHGPSAAWQETYGRCRSESFHGAPGLAKRLAGYAAIGNGDSGIRVPLAASCFARQGIRAGRTTGRACG